MRAISTVLDVAVFLVLVTAAVGTVAYAPAPVDSSHTAQETAAVLATTTATVDYELQGSHRQSHATLGTLLGNAAVSNATIDGTSLTPMAGPFRAAVRAAVTARLPHPNRTHVTAVWQPYPDSPLRGEIHVGAPPPSGVDVAVATVTVPVAVEATAVERVAQMSGTEGLSLQAASAVTGELLPSTEAAAAPNQDGPTGAVTTARYRAFADALGVSVEGALARGSVTSAHRAVTRALAERFEREMQQRFASPAAVRKALQTGTVTLTVRRWQP